MKTTMVMIRGNEYEVNPNLSEFHFFCFYDLIDGIEIYEVDDPRYGAALKQMASRYSSPSTQGRLAYALTQIFPEIPEDIAWYGTRLVDGVETSQFRLGISIQDFFAIIQALTPLMQKMADSLEDAQVQTNGSRPAPQGMQALPPRRRRHR